MKNILSAPFVELMRKTTANMYRLGWDERNGGNISYLLDTDEINEYLDTNKVIRTIPLGFDAPELTGKIFIVTGTGKYFKNVESDPENNLGIVKIALDYFDASINRIAAWTVGLRNVQKALLMALCTPDLSHLQNSDNWTELMVRNEELKTMPFGEIWKEYCRVCNAPADGEWFETVKKYEAEVLSKRG